MSSKCFLGSVRCPAFRRSVWCLMICRPAGRDALCHGHYFLLLPGSAGISPAVAGWRIDPLAGGTPSVAKALEGTPALPEPAPRTIRYIIFNSVSAISDGVAATPMPAALNAAIFAFAVPSPPLMMAPAWPMRRPGGAVAPAMNPATGFLQFFLIH